jgi:hypothetical protein
MTIHATPCISKVADFRDTRRSVRSQREITNTIILTSDYLSAHPSARKMPTTAQRISMKFGSRVLVIYSDKSTNFY